ncbi:endonuclease domain-containing protein [Sphingomonas tabacisoli]|uniref:Endonuclease domain-containing protein n=1 Tax=Sphingomonas tabacisoli TaxID=2249466 RepID=A0ABW4I1Q2_9SPHN
MLLFLCVAVAAFVLWHFLPGSKPPSASPQFRQIGATPDDDDWFDRVKTQCESPAEVAFLAAMVREYELRPRQGSLRNDRLKLDMQVKDGGYRIDFLANDWLIIEIDGAAYHSSKMDQARDRARDEHLEGLGYSVLRIPAKVVFAQPDEAVRKVGEALNRGKRQIPAHERRSGFTRLNETMSGLNKALTEVNDGSARQRKLQAAMTSAEKSFAIERHVIDSAIEAATRTMEIEEYIGGSQEKRDAYERNFRELEEAFRSRQEGLGVAANYVQESVIVVPQFAAMTTGEIELDAQVQQVFRRLEAERAEYLTKVRQQLSSNPQLRSLAKDELSRLGCPEVWSRIS